MFQSANSQSVTSSDSENGVLCYCHRPTKIVRAWTRKNPGCRFYSCIDRRGANGWVSCKFFDWYDKEEPHGWQHVALLEAEQTIKEQKAEIEGLKIMVRTQTHHSDNAGNSNAVVVRLYLMSLFGIL
uniref:GRF-type domain-containing protein n=2 Tax=Noccaea caerulescens TaxID=107243 RepID=A0A1J3EV78_NOCCA